MFSKRTWRAVTDEIIKTKRGQTRERWERASRDHAYDVIRDLPVFETRAEHFLRVLVEGTKVTISGPAKFELARLFYLGSEKGDGDIGQYGEGFKAAAVCLLRDHGIEPVAVSGDQVVYLRVDSEKISGTQLQPVIYDFFRSSEVCHGARLILRGCSNNLIAALKEGLNHFFFDQNPLLGAKICSPCIRPKPTPVMCFTSGSSAVRFPTCPSCSS